MLIPDAGINLSCHFDRMGEISKPTKLARDENQIQKIMAANWPP